jgi:hypothetical protein
MRPVLKGTALVVLFSNILSYSLSSQTINLNPGHSAVSLMYLQPLTAVVSLEQSPDLAAWRSVSPSTTVLTQTKADEVLRATLPITSTASKSFFRLQVENGWKVNLKWDASRSPGVAGYHLYYGFASGNYTHSVDVGNVLQTIASVPLTAEVCYLVVTAYDEIGLQSSPSSEIKVRLHPKKKRPRSG